MTIESQDDIVALQYIGTIVAPRRRTMTETADGWALVGARGNLAAQYERTLIITCGEPIVVTRH